MKRCREFRRVNGNRRAVMKEDLERAMLAITKRSLKTVNRILEVYTLKKQSWFF